MHIETTTNLRVSIMQKYISFDGAKHLLGGRSRASLYRDIKSGRLPVPIKIGHRRYWEIEKLIDAIEALKPDPPP
jgi:predicted DNA-binding transcriptional regulator AlpA